VRAADDTPDCGADDHGDDGNVNDGASPRAIPRYPRDVELVVFRRRFFLAGVAHCTGAVADRARIMLARSNERKMGRSLTTLSLLISRRRWWVGWLGHIPVFLIVLCRFVVVEDPMIRVLLLIRGRGGEYSPRSDQTG